MLWTTVGIVVLGGLGTLGALWLQDPFGHGKIRSKLAIGLTEAEVAHRLGRSPSRVFERDTAPIDYYVDGWDYKERKITNRVLIFRFGEPICYVWIGDDGRVEDFYVGGS